MVDELKRQDKQQELNTENPPICWYDCFHVCLPHMIKNLHQILKYIYRFWLIYDKVCRTTNNGGGKTNNVNGVGNSCRLFAGMGSP